MLASLGSWFSTYALHPLEGLGYQWWSGMGSCLSYISGPTIALTAWWHHKNCHVRGCWRKGHPDPEHGHPVCRRHQPNLKPRITGKLARELADEAERGYDLSLGRREPN